MKAWLKGGIIGIVISIIWGPFSLLYAPQEIRYITTFLVPSSLGTLLTEIGPGFPLLFVWTLYHTILFFIIGALIGLVIEKIRSKS